MKLIVILNVNPNENINTKICNNREYTHSELKAILLDNFTGFAEKIIFYDNFEKFKENVSNHLDDFVLNFDLLSLIMSLNQLALHKTLLFPI